MNKPRSWFTSDLHISHRAVLGFSNRPYANVTEMDADLIFRIKVHLNPGDLLYILGDLSFGSPSYTRGLLNQLGKSNPMFWILGNHDKRGAQKGLAKYFEWIGHYKEIKVNGEKVVLSHYPFESWNGMYRGSWMLHGHSHGNLQRKMPRRFDVGVDCWDMNPVSFEELVAWQTDYDYALEQALHSPLQFKYEELVDHHEGA